MDQVSIDVSNIECQIEELIAKDNVEGFLSLVKDHSVKQCGNNKQIRKKHELVMSKLLQLICYHRAIECATVVVLGKTPGHVDLNAALEDGMFPLHHAALSLSRRLTGLFLNYGAETFLKCSGVGHRFHGLLPLEVALETLSYHVKWTPKESIFKLVTMLSLLENTDPLNTLELLAWNTTEVKQVFLRLAREGKLIELAALLTVAKEKVIPRKDCILALPEMKKYGNESEDDCTVHEDMTLRQYIASEMAFLIDEENKSMLNGFHTLAQMIKEKKTWMMSEMLLLEVFRRAGDAIRLYRWSQFFDGSQFSSATLYGVSKAIAIILEDAGFALTNGEIFLKAEDCFSAELLKRLSEKPKPNLYQDAFYPGARRLISTMDTSAPRLKRVMQQIMLRGVSGRKKELSFAMRPFHALRTFSSYASEIPTTMEAQVKRAHKLTEHRVPHLLSSKQVSFMLAINRRIRCI